MQQSLITLAEVLATTGGTFNALPFIIGAIVLVVLGGAALLFLRRRKAADGAAGPAAGEVGSSDAADRDGLS